MKKILLVILFLCLFICGCGKKEQPQDDLAKITKKGEIIVGVRDDIQNLLVFVTKMEI